MTSDAVQFRLPLADAGGDDWRVDQRTREVGRRGLAEARAALAAATRRAQDRHEMAAVRRQAA
jgi:hypothetical protein